MRPGPPNRRTALRVFGAAGVSMAMGGALLLELVRRGRLQRVRRTDARMGTLVSVEVVHEDPAAARDAVGAAFATMDSLEAVLSRHDETSVLSRLNREGRVDRPPSSLREVLTTAQDLYNRTRGAFDVTIAPLLNLHANAYQSEGREPRREEIRLALARVGFQDLHVGPDAVVLDRPGMSVTLDGIAKGYVVDSVIEELRAAGIEEVLVDAGGDIGAAGSGPEGSGWPVAVPGPPGMGVETAGLRLQGGAVATSGDYMQSFTQDRRVHHIIDPRSGLSPGATAAVSVRARTAMWADALSTAAMVLGPEEGASVLEALPGVEALLVGKTGETRATSGWSLP